MNALQALLLGLTQGLTEFLPISSSGHLVILQKIMDLEQPPLVFDVTLHLGTLLSILWVFKKQIISLDNKTARAILMTLIPTGIIGFFLNSLGDKLFDSLKIVGFSLLFTSGLLYSTRFIKPKKNHEKPDLNYKKSLIIGISQGLAIFPGISRSGTTISTGLWLGLSPSQSFTFSFLISIPAIIAAQMVQSVNHGFSLNLPLKLYMIGFFSAAISGFIALKMLKIVVGGFKLHLFAFYTFLLSVSLLVFEFFPV